VKRRRAGLTDVQAGIITAVLLVVIVYFGFTKAIPFQHHFTVHAAFANSNGLRKGSPVRIAGVNVGTVTAMRLLPREAGQPPAALVDMRINSEGLPLHTDATAKVRPRIFLEGNFFIDLTQGSPSAPILKDGGTIPVSQTADPVQLDQVLAALPTATRSDLQRLLRELAVGFGGRGTAALNETTIYMQPAYQSTSVVNQALLGQDVHDLSSYIASAGATAQATDADPQALQSLLSSFDATAAALDAENANLAAAVHELPNTLSAAQPALAALDRSFGPVQALAGDLRPAVQSSLPAVNAAIPLARQLRLLVQRSELGGLVSDLRPTVPALARLNTETVPLLSQVRAASSCQNTIVLPWSRMTLGDPAFPATGPVYQEAVKWLPGIAGESRAGDANGQWFRTLLIAPNFIQPIPGSNAFQMSANPIQGANPPKPSELPMLRSGVPCETQQLPNLDTQNSGPPAGQRALTVPNTPAYQARYARGEAGAVRLARQLIKQAGLAGVLRVADTPITSSLISNLRALAKW
jgi:virulence factor Mce-like protein